MSSDWDPRIITFCCNWCSYAGADLAGVSRYQYPPNIHIIRVMCSGRIEPHFVLNALKNGADGVLVTGCHIGDCHYISGNEKTLVRMDGVTRILELLGIEPGRMKREWISASEGQRFAQVITEFVTSIKELGPNTYVPKKVTKEVEAETLTQKTGFEFCIECNKCASSCPITRVDYSYSPSENVFTRSLEPGDDGMILPRAWDCLTCGLCSQRCPSGVKYEELIRGERSRSRQAGNSGNCAHGEVLELITDFQSQPDLKQHRLDWITDGLEIADKSEVLYFVGCAPYFEHAIFNDVPEDTELKKIGPEMLENARVVIKLLNRAGIQPIVMPDERCCGHDALWTGDEPKFKQLAEINIENIKSSGAKKVVVACAEGYRTLKIDYPKYFGELGFEVLHTSEYFSQLIDEGKLTPTQPVNLTVAYQDPCRLGRHAQVVDPPRKILESISGLNLVKFDMEGRDATCCGGPNGWKNCGQLTRRIQFEKFKELRDKKVDTIITACPKCYIHFKCATNSKLPSDLDGITIHLQDLNMVLEQSTRGGDQK